MHPSPEKKQTIAIAGLPNSGKTSLFNLLTASCQAVGNWSGTTVDTHMAACQNATQHYDLYDLPGAYNPFPTQAKTGLDETFAQAFLNTKEIDLVIQVIDAPRLSSQLFFTLQLIEMGLPLLIVVNKAQDASLKKTIDYDLLESTLGVKVMPISTQNTQHKQPILNAIDAALKNKSTPKTPWLNSTHLEAIHKAMPEHNNNRHQIIHMLEGNTYTLNKMKKDIKTNLIELKTQCETTLEQDIDTYIADLRYRFIHKLSSQIEHHVNYTHPQHKKNERLDACLTHPFFGMLAFFAIIYALFFTAEVLGGIVQDLLTSVSELFLVDGVKHLLNFWHAPTWLMVLLGDGLGEGITTTLSFFPVIFIMFFLMSIMEESGYMARASWVMDRHMRRIGLSGPSIVPLLIGFGCNVPAILATRTLKNPYERMLTTMMIPFMSCSARLSVYAIFASAFFPFSGHNVVFLLYLIGMAIAIITALLIQTFFPSQEKSKLTLALPEYQRPRWSVLTMKTQNRTQHFLKRAAKMIIPLVMVLSLMEHLNWQTPWHWTLGGDIQNTWIGHSASLMAPIFHPMGLTHDNWPAIIALLVGVIAKEVIVGTLNALYTGDSSAMTDWQPWQSMRDTLHNTWIHLKALPHTIIHPIDSLLTPDHFSSNAYQHLVHAFHSTHAAFAYLLFTLLYFPCVSTMATIAEEHNWRVAWASVIWSILVGYGVAVGYYQTAIGNLSFETLGVGSSIIIIGLMSKRFINRHRTRIA